MFYHFNRGTVNLKNNVVIWSLHESDFSSSYACEVRSPKFEYKSCHYTLAIWLRHQTDSEKWFGVCVYPNDQLQHSDFFLISIVNDKSNIQSCKIERSGLGLYRNEKFIKWSEFLSLKSKILPNNCLTMVCEILSYEDTSTQAYTDDKSVTGCTMSFFHNAAEFLIEVISKSPNCCISYGSLKNSVKQADNKDIASYFESESKYKYIFQKFPEIFNYKNDLISLSDIFISYYCCEKDSKSTSVSYSLQLKRCAILYFLKILTLAGPLPYISLFRTFINDKTLRCAEYFNYSTDSDALNFFTSNSKYFVLSNDIVSVNSANQLCIDVLYVAEKNSMRKINKYVCFLLKCFESLHYFPLKECISYAERDCRMFLSQFSLLKQREFFENIPNTAIDKYGFLTLKDKEVSLPFLKERKMKLLMICILAFKKKMYFKDLINEAIEKSDLSVVYYRTISCEDQLRFLKNFPLNFIISDDGFVSLLPTFSLAKCTLKDLSCKAISSFGNLSQDVLSKEANSINNLSQVQSKIINSSNNLTQEVQSKANSSLDSPEQKVESFIHPVQSKSNSPNQTTFSSKNRTILIQKQNREPQNVNSPIINKYSLCITTLPRTVNERIKVSVFYLLKHFYSPDYLCMLKTLLHALDDFRITFTSLLEGEKQKLILIFCNFMKTIPPIEFDCETPVFEIINKEKFLLVVSYILIHHKKMHYEKILSVLRSKNIHNSLSACSKSNQINYFKTFAGYMNITPDEHLTLSETIDPVAKVIDSYLHLLLKYQFSPKCFPFLDPSEKVVFSEKTSSKPEATLSLIMNEKSSVPEYEEKSKVHNNIVESTSCMDNLPENICKFLSSSVYFLKKYFKIATVNGSVLTASIISQNVLNYYFCSLGASRQAEFIKECLAFINNNDNISYLSPISISEEMILCISYLLLENEKLHFDRITKYLEKISVATELCKKRPKEQFKYFKNKEKYFVIDSDGFVTLKLSFRFMISLVDFVISQTKEPKTPNPNQSSLSASAWKIPLQSDVFVTSPNGNSKCFSSGKQLDNSKMDFGVSRNVHDSNDIFKFSASSSVISSNSRRKKKKKKSKKGNQTLLENIDKDLTETSKHAYVEKSYKSLSKNFQHENNSTNSSNSSSSKSTNNNPYTTVKTTNKRENQVKELNKVDEISGENVKKNSNIAPSAIGSDEIQMVFDSKHADIQVVFDSHFQVNKLPNENKEGTQNQLSSQKLPDIGKRYNAKDSVNVSFKKKVDNKFKQDDKPSYISSTTEKKEKNALLTVSKGIDKINIPRQPFHVFNSSQQLTSGLSLSNSEKNDSISETAILTNSFQNLSVSDNCKPVIEEAISKSTSTKLLTENYKDNTIMNSGFNDHKSLIENQKSTLSRDVLTVEEHVKNPVNASLDPKHKFDCDSIHKAYISDLVDIYLIKEPLDSSKASKNSMMKSVTNDSVVPKEEKVPSNLPQQVFDCSKNNGGILTDSHNSVFCNKSDVPSTSNCDYSPILPRCKSRTDSVRPSEKVPSSSSKQLLTCTKSNSTVSTEIHNSPVCENANIPSTCDSASSISQSASKHAVNFFSVVLGNYERYNSGISASILKRHLHFASPEVQSYMQEHFKYDFLSFFQNHTDVFFVSKQSQLIYLLKNN